MTKEMTPCEKLGYKVGDKFKFLDDTSHLVYNHGEDVVAILALDDGSEVPLFIVDGQYDSEEDYEVCNMEGYNDADWQFEYLDQVEKITDEVPAPHKSTQHIFQVGDKVKVVKKCESQSNCHYGEKWDCFWVPVMDVYIGEVGLVMGVYTKAADDVVGIRVDFGSYSWNFPSEALELIDTSVSEYAHKQSLLDKFYTFKEALGTSFDVALIISSKITLEFDGYEFSGDEARIIDVMDKLVDLHG